MRSMTVWRMYCAGSLRGSPVWITSHGVLETTHHARFLASCAWCRDPSEFYLKEMWRRIGGFHSSSMWWWKLNCATCPKKYPFDDLHGCTCVRHQFKILSYSLSDDGFPLSCPLSRLCSFTEESSPSDFLWSAFAKWVHLNEFVAVTSSMWGLSVRDVQKNWTWRGNNENTFWVYVLMYLIVLILCVPHWITLILHKVRRTCNSQTNTQVMAPHSNVHLMSENEIVTQTTFTNYQCLEFDPINRAHSFLSNENIVHGITLFTLYSL